MSLLEVGEARGSGGIVEYVGLDKADFVTVDTGKGSHEPYSHFGSMLGGSSVTNLGTPTSGLGVTCPSFVDSGRGYRADTLAGMMYDNCTTVAEGGFCQPRRVCVATFLSENG